MKIYTLEEKDGMELEETLECIAKKAEKFLKRMEAGEFGYRRGYRDEEDWDDYDWKIKKGGRYSRY